ncbi:hypothetical protein [Fodinibius saliphilus]|uniref:hypothetical protein n=1 Tax=Fodinibius saliphilus TaxID=1920650 RepID=UPI00110947D2|nr:hypothetical protein [Fodinibius saliphilus]
MSNNPFNSDFELDKCAFCKLDRELRESHIIPKSFGKWVKKTSATGFLRNAENPNLRRQDVWKTKLLCDECEQRFGVYEKKFMEKIFRPYHKSADQVLEYDIWLPKFIASINWRILKCYQLAGALNNYPRGLRILIPKALSKWHDFIVGEITSPDGFELHLLPVDLLESHTFHDLPSNFNRYMARGFGTDIVYSSKAGFIYTKLAKFMLFGFISRGDQDWKGTKVTLGKGKIKPKTKYELPGGFGNYLIERSQKVQDISSSYSETQREKINQFIKDNPEKVTNTEMFKAFQQDLQMFGDRAFLEEE